MGGRRAVLVALVCACAWSSGLSGAAGATTTTGSTTTASTSVPPVTTPSSSTTVASATTVATTPGATTTVTAGPTTTTTPSADAPYYLALGDSLAVGCCDSQTAHHGYVDLLYAWYRHKVSNLQLQDYGCSSETTDSFIKNSLCGGSQLDKGLQFLHAHHGHIALLTIDIGGNDVVFCGSNPDPAGCFTKALAHMDANLKSILSQLRAAAGPDVPFVSMTYFDPLLYQWFNGSTGQANAKQSVAAVVALNQHVGDDYGPTRTLVAQVGAAFAVDDYTLVDSNFGHVPRNVARACAWLDISHGNTCNSFGDDANVAGYRVIAAEFENALSAPAPDTTTVATDSDTGLASTGSGSMALTLVAFALVAAGALLLGVRRRNRPSIAD